MSFEAAQLSRITRVLVPSKNVLITFNPRFNLVLLADDDKQSQISLANPFKGLVVKLSSKTVWGSLPKKPLAYETMSKFSRERVD